MADEEFSVRLDVEGGGESALSISEFENSFVSLKAKVETAIAVFEKCAEVIGAVAERFDKVSGIADAFAGSVDNASQRTGGMIAQMDLMIASNTLAQRGIQLTAEELGNVSVRAVQFAEATGQDTKQALDQLTGALVSGSERALKPFGVELEKGQRGAEGTRSALQQLARSVGGQSAGPDSLADAFDAAKNRLTDLADTFIIAGNRSGEYARAQRELAEAFNALYPGVRVYEALKEAVRDFGITTAFYVGEAAGQLHAFAIAMQGVAQAIGHGDFAAAAQMIGSFQQQTQVRADTSQQRLLGATLNTRGQEGVVPAQRPRPPGGGGGGGAGPTDRFRVEGEFLHPALLDQATSEAGPGPGKDTERQFADRSAAAQRRAADESRRVWERFYDARDRLEDDLHKKQLKHLAEQQEEIEAVASEASGFLRGVFDEAQKSDDAFGKAFLKGSAERLKIKGEDVAFEGVAALLTAIGLTITNPPAAGTKYAEGFGKIALGASVGAAGAALGAAAGGGGGGAPPARPQESAASRRSRGGSGDGGQVTYITHLYAPNLMATSTEAEAGEKLTTALGRSARRNRE